MKSEVKELAKELGVIDEILQAPPTDGLWGDERTDEDQLGATYEELEWAMGQTIETFKEYNSWSNREKEVWTIFNNLYDKNKHKMEPIPVCLK